MRVPGQRARPSLVLGKCVQGGQYLRSQNTFMWAFLSRSSQPSPGPERMHQRLGGVVPEREDGRRLWRGAALPADRVEQAHRGERGDPTGGPLRGGAGLPCVPLSCLALLAPGCEPVALCHWMYLLDLQRKWRLRLRFPFPAVIWSLGGEDQAPLLCPVQWPPGLWSSHFPPWVRGQCCAAPFPALGTQAQP